MEFLKKAQDYAESIGDEFWFCEHYARYREYYGVQESVERTLETLYGYNFVL
jgi:hypothetical protein